jgi:hypothetical protein
MSQNKNEGLSQTNELICPPMTLAQQVRGTIALTRLSLEVARLFIAIIKLYRSMPRRPLPEIAVEPGGDSGEMEHNVAEQPL